MRTIFIIIFVIIAISGILYTTYGLRSPQTFISPLSATPPINQLTDQPINLISYAFLPYWTLKDLSEADLNQLTHLTYFDLPVTAAGNLDTNALSYRRFLVNHSLLQSYQQKYRLSLLATITTPNDETLYTLLNSESAQTNLINQLQLFTVNYKLSGLNIDFEPQTATDAATINNFTNLIRRLTDYPINQISVSIYPSAATSPKLWDLPALAPLVNHFVVMTYDYFRAGSDTSGSIAPLYPGNPTDRHAVIRNLAQISVHVPTQKILLGMPLYGYQWPTESEQFKSPVLGPGQLATHHRIAALLQERPELQVRWQPTTLTPWLVFIDQGVTHQIHFDNALSLSYKHQLVQAAGLAGVAYWALGYGPLP